MLLWAHLEHETLNEAAVWIICALGGGGGLVAQLTDIHLNWLAAVRSSPPRLHTCPACTNSLQLYRRITTLNPGKRLIIMFLTRNTTADHLDEKSKILQRSPCRPGAATTLKEQHNPKPTSTSACDLDLSGCVLCPARRTEQQRRYNMKSKCFIAVTVATITTALMSNYFLKLKLLTSS